MGKIALWILAVVGALELMEVALQLWIGQFNYQSPVASPYFRGKNSAMIAVIAVLAICGGIAVARWARSKLDWFTWRVGW